MYLLPDGADLPSGVGSRSRCPSPTPREASKQRGNVLVCGLRLRSPPGSTPASCDSSADKMGETVHMDGHQGARISGTLRVTWLPGTLRLARMGPPLTPQTPARPCPRPHFLSRKGPLCTGRKGVSPPRILIRNKPTRSTKPWHPYQKVRLAVLCMTQNCRHGMNTWAGAPSTSV